MYRIINKEFEPGMLFKGCMNGKIIKIINASDKLITYKCMETGKIFTMGRKTMERCYLERI